MAEPTIEIIIAAQAEQFKAELNEVQRRLKRLETQTGKTGARIRKNFTKNTNQAQNALRDFSRVVQDAPFGIIGVGNNIQELSGSFGFLVRSAGGVRAAFAGLAGALSGPGGLILLVAAVTTALTIFEQRGGSTENVIKSLQDEIDTLNEKLSTLRNLAEADIRIADLEGGDTKQARQDLIDLLETQQTLNQGKVDELIATRDNITAIRLQKTALGGLADVLRTGIANVWRDIKRDVSFVAAVAITSANALSQTLGLTQALIDQDKVSNELSEEEIELNKLINQQILAGKKLRVQALEQQKKLNEEEKKTAGKKPKKIDEGKLFSLLDRLDADAQLENLSQGFADVFNLSKDLPPLIPPDTSEFRKFFDSLSAIADEGSFEIQQALQKILDQEAFLQNIEDAKAGLKEGFNDLFLDTINEGIADLAGSVTAAIANGENVFLAVGQSLLQTFGRFLTKYGTLLITYGKLTAAKGKLDVASAIGGPAAIAAGLAAIKVGIAATAAGAALSALASSGLFGAGGAGGVSSTGGGSNTVNAPSFAPSEQVVVFEIAGDKLIGVLDNTSSRNNRISGGRIR